MGMHACQSVTKKNFNNLLLISMRKKINSQATMNRTRTLFHKKQSNHTNTFFYYDIKQASVLSLK